MNQDTAAQLVQIRDALEMLGIDFCAACGEPHNTRSPMASRRYRQHITLSVKDGFKTFCVQPDHNCLDAWLAEHANGVDEMKLGRSLSFWIIESGAYKPDSPHHRMACAMAEGYDLRFDLLMARYAKSQGGELHGRTEKELLTDLGYKWDVDATRLRDRVLDFIEDVRDGKKPGRPPVFLVKKAA